MKSLYDFNYEQMAELALSHEWKKFRGHQIFQWLYRKRVTSIDEMSDLMVAQRAYQLNARLIQTADQILETINNLRR